MNGRNGRITVTRVYQEVSEVREHMARLRGELNGNLPRLIRQVDRLTDAIQGHQREAQTDREQVRSCLKEVERLRQDLSAKADKESNDDAHKRIWLLIRLSLYAIAGGLGLLALERFL